MVDKNVTVEYDSHFFETPIKNNYSATAPSAQFVLGYNPPQYQHNNKTHICHVRNSLHPESIILVLYIEKLTGKHSVKNHRH